MLITEFLENVTTLECFPSCHVECKDFFKNAIVLYWPYTPLSILISKN